MNTINLQKYAPKAEFKQKHLLTLMDYTADEIMQVLSLGLHLKAQLKAGVPHRHLANKTLAMIFSKSSTRTRVSFEVGTVQMGGYPMFLSSNDIQLGRGETISDTARVLSRMVDGIMIRTFAQSDVEGLAEYGSIPVINGLTDLVHPCQALADILTFYECAGDLAGKKLAFFGDGNNVCHSLLIICAKLGIHFAAANPAGYSMDEAIVKASYGYAAESGAEITLTEDPYVAASGADALYTDVWASMGQEKESAVRIKALSAYAVTPELMAAANPDAIFMHCLPAHRGEEVAASVIDGSQSRIFQEAENRLHAQKAVMALLMSGKSYAELMK